jgi:hypothetical protein
MESLLDQRTVQRPQHTLENFIRDVKMSEPNEKKKFLHWDDRSLDELINTATPTALKIKIKKQ